MNFFDIGPLELIVIFVVILLIFGPDKLGEFSRGVSKSLRKFRETSAELTQAIRREIDDAEVAKKADAPQTAPAAITGPQASPDPGPTSKTGSPHA